MTDGETGDRYVEHDSGLCAHPPLASAKIVISTRFNNKQQAFFDFVLYHYVRVGVEELDQEKLTLLLRLKYHNSISDALADLGQAEQIGQVFAGFQKYLHQPQGCTTRRDGR
jgi:type I restriction enzyme R subunit